MAPRSPLCASRTRAQWCCSTSWASDACASRARPTRDKGLWRRLQAAARRVGTERLFPGDTQGGILDDHIPFVRQGVPSIDLIDFDFPCWHRSCDNLGVVSQRSVDAVGETVYELARRL